MEHAWKTTAAAAESAATMRCAKPCACSKRSGPKHRRRRVGSSNIGRSTKGRCGVRRNKFFLNWNVLFKHSSQRRWCV